jgi:uncharacterized membrane-anchored protein YitT (DUF2179 family)
MNNHKIDWTDIFSLQTVLFTILSVLTAGVALKGFMIPNHFLDGGITGISIIIHEVFHYNIGLIIIVLNLPFLFIGYKKMGATFLFQSTVSILLLALFMNFVSIPTFTEHKVLIAIFGGGLIGAGVGFAIKAGGMIDGLEVIAEFTNKKFGLQTTEIILFINSTLFLIAAIHFGIETAMFSILTYFSATKAADYVVDGFESYTVLTVVSHKHDLVKEIIVKGFQKAITVYKGERGYLLHSFDEKYDCDIIMTVVTRLEIHRIKQTILDADPKAFFYVQNVREVGGGVVKKLKKH